MLTLYRCFSESWFPAVTRRSVLLGNGSISNTNPDTLSNLKISSSPAPDLPARKIAGAPVLKKYIALPSGAGATPKPETTRCGAPPSVGTGRPILHRVLRRGDNRSR